MKIEPCSRDEKPQTAKSCGLRYIISIRGGVQCSSGSSKSEKSIEQA